MAEEDAIEETSEEDIVPPDSAGKFSGLKKLFLNKMVIFSAIGLLILILAGVAYFVFFSSSDEVVTDSEDPMVTESSSPDSDSLSNEAELELPSIPDDASIEPDSLSLEDTPSAPKSRVEQISQGMKTSSSPDNTEEANNASSATNSLEDELAELKRQMTAQQNENAKLQQQIEKLNSDRTLSGKPAPTKDLSVPIDRLQQSTSSIDNNVPPAPYVYLDSNEASDYKSSPYADDEQTPAPTWGK